MLFYSSLNQVESETGSDSHPAYMRKIQQKNATTNSKTTNPSFLGLGFHSTLFFLGIPTRWQCEIGPILCRRFDCENSVVTICLLFYRNWFSIHDFRRRKDTCPAIVCCYIAYGICVATITCRKECVTWKWNTSQSHKLTLYYVYTYKNVYLNEKCSDWKRLVSETWDTFVEVDSNTSWVVG